jgi:hypothetical protein
MGKTGIYGTAKLTKFATENLECGYYIVAGHSKTQKTRLVTQWFFAES